MLHNISIRTVFLCIVVFISANGCKDDSTSPEAKPQPGYLSGGRFHGTWVSFYAQSDSLKMSFDSTGMRFIDQFGYDYGIRREFPGTFSVTDSNLFLTYDYGHREAVSYQFSNNILSLSNHRQFSRISTTPSYYGWSEKLQIVSEYTLSHSSVSIQSYCHSDSGAIALATMGYDVTPHLLQIQMSGLIPLGLAPGIKAIDARGSFLWIVTDSSIAKRTITDTTVISSFSYRNFVGPDYHPTGIAVDSGYCFLMTVGSISSRGILLKYTLDGVLLDAVFSSAVIKDVCLVNGRLFCLEGDETFYELNTATGRAVSNYNLRGRPFGNNIDGIAFTDSTIQFASRDSVGRLRVSDVHVP